MNLKLLFLLLMMFGASIGFSQDTHGNADEHKKDDLNVGDFIIEHVSDSYDWHITTIGHTHISIPLLVILKSKEQGWVFFMSNKLHNDEHKYKNFVINHDHPIYKGKIMEVLPDGSEVRPFDISITKNVLALLMISITLVWVFISIAKRYKNNPQKAPKGLQAVFEPLILFIQNDVAKSVIGEKNYQKYTPFLLSIFFFILINNLMGLIPFFPGGYNLTGNIAVTMVLALFTFIITTVSGTKHYWQHIFWSPIVPWWLKVPLPLMPIVEIMGVFTKPFVLMVRLFANMLAGHIVMLAFFSLIFIFGSMSVAAGFGVSVISILFTIFDFFLEILVAFIQAFVFVLLSAIYFSMSLESEH